ncbi:Trypanosome variant surface glycoprotein (A-type), putative [Trypanosoma equiperdum]|uniref:Trypanosome variant surface glycoprotein (A-type), putative n=1 Tax=Trypanosoma equiperdum TaxID=5694 RepID=A0A1G4I1A2_TRYEQ|nr:Trypanosome variant surface glycoprotein (A-type), putative [Trypanosoma equiperdum]
MAAKITASGSKSCLAVDTSGGFRANSAAFAGIAAGCTDPTADITTSDDLSEKFTTTGYDDERFKAANDVGGTKGSHDCALTHGLATNKIVDETSGASVEASPAFAGGLYTRGTSQLLTMDLRTLTGAGETYPTLHRAQKHT